MAFASIPDLIWSTRLHSSPLFAPNSWARLSRMHYSDRAVEQRPNFFLLIKQLQSNHFNTDRISVFLFRKSVWFRSCSWDVRTFPCPSSSLYPPFSHHCQTFRPTKHRLFWAVLLAFNRYVVLDSSGGVWSACTIINRPRTSRSEAKFSSANAEAGMFVSSSNHFEMIQGLGSNLAPVTKCFKNL